MRSERPTDATRGLLVARPSADGICENGGRGMQPTLQNDLENALLRDAPPLDTTDHVFISGGFRCAYAHKRSPTHIPVRAGVIARFHV